LNEWISSTTILAVWRVDTNHTLKMWADVDERDTELKKEELQSQ
jgi:hypothetical protein